ncbi:MAG: BamA/TamA family outer membrane protein [Bacteroidales bacterium]|nr:BamA/TamA family outer membrane protein [Bacteroidales bacterium]
MASCANISNVLQDDEYLLYRNHYDIRMTDGTPATSEVIKALSDMDKYVRQQPKNGLLGIYQSIFNPYYYVSISDSSWWARTMRNIGTRPVIYSHSASLVSAQQIQSLLEGKGSFRSQVAVDTTHLTRRRVVVNYHVMATPRYKIDDIDYHVSDTAVAMLLDQWSTSSTLHIGDYYDQDNLVGERDRIARRLQNNGYFYATPDLIHYILDTTYAPQRIGLELHIDNPQVTLPDRSTERRPFQKYSIDSIFIDSNNVRQSTIRSILPLRAGMTYAPFRSTAAYNALVNLRNFNLINIEYSESPHSHDTARLLNTHIRLHNSKQQRISASLEISNSSPLSSESKNNGNFGAETVLQYQNKNLFGCAELLSIEANVLVELNKSVFNDGISSLRKNLSAFETGINASIDLPRFLFPYGNRLMRDNSLPHTTLGLGIGRQSRSYFERRLANANFSYNWNASRRVQHRLTPFEISFVQFPSFSDAFLQRIRSMLDNRILYQYSDHLIINARYNITFSNQRIGRKDDFSYLTASIETAGNLAALIATTTSLGSTDHDWGSHTLFDVSYSQYLRLNGEYKHYFYHGSNNILVTRCVMGLGIPYGNSTSMPYEKSFFGGGPNNLRAWQIRHLGPGHYNSHDDDFIFDQTGDITLVINIEERFPIYGPFEGALFADMGNVWLFRKDPYLPGGEFQLKNLLSDMALGIGVGLRLKISILTLRLDLALPAYDPTYERNQRWRLPRWKFNSINANFGIDYPF